MAHVPDACLHVLAMDNPTTEYLSRLRLPGMTVVPLEELESECPQLKAVKAGRTTLEYYYTCTPVWIRFVLTRRRDIQALTYLDADLFFFSSPMPLLKALDSVSILLTPLRHPPELKFADQLYGRFNVGFIGLRNDDVANQCVARWEAQCLEWCYDRVEDGRFADQKYLDEWPERYHQIGVISHPGANVAFWNWKHLRIRSDNGLVTVDEQPLIFCHFSRVVRIARRAFAVTFDHPFRTPSQVRKLCFDPYLRALDRTSALVPGLTFNGMDTRLPRISHRQVLRSLWLRNVGIVRDRGVLWI